MPFITRKAVRLIAGLALAASLAGCLVPEKFSAAVEMKPDGSYTYKYDGTATHALAAMAIKKQGALTAKDEAGLKQEADKAAKAPGVRKLDYLGSGRYQVSVDRELKPGQQPDLMKIVSVTKDTAGVFTIAGSPLKQKDKDGLKELGIKIDGTLEVRLPANAKVVSQNADGTPGLISKAYSWKIGSVDARPEIKFQLAP